MAKEDDFGVGIYCLMNYYKMKVWKVGMVDDFDENDDDYRNDYFFHQLNPGLHLVMIAFFYEIQSYNKNFSPLSRGCKIDRGRRYYYICTRCSFRILILTPWSENERERNVDSNIPGKVFEGYTWNTLE